MNRNDKNNIVVQFDNPITTKAIEIWGIDGQKAILQEECGELITALSRLNRGRTGVKPVAEEAADVLVCMMSVIPALGIRLQVQEYMLDKLIRLDNTIKMIKMREGYSGNK